MMNKVAIDLSKKLRNLDKDKKIHFIGIGGIGVSGIAKCFLGLGYRVSGSDIKSNKNTDLLEKLGAEIFIEHKADNLCGVGVIVASSAIKLDNAEIVEAKKQNIEIFHRSHALEAILSESSMAIGFSGTHGKTSSTGMASLVFELSGKEPTSVIGGVLPQFKTNAKLGNGNFAIAELDESDGTIQLYQPDITVITNLEVDHVDHYKDGFSQLLATFKTFADNLTPEAKLVLNADDAGVKEFCNCVNFENKVFYSMHSDSDYQAKNIVFQGLSSKFDVLRKGILLGTINLNVPGKHNVSNALGVIAASLEAGLEFSEIQRAISEFRGTGRRFEFVGNYFVGEGCAKIYDDYAHHPTEVIATLSSAKMVKSHEGRVVAIFQPHRYSRFKCFWDEFKSSFSDADFVIVTDVFAAGEKPLKGFNSEHFANETGARYIEGNIDEIKDSVCDLIRANDLVLTIGAGDITRLGREICSKV